MVDDDDCLIYPLSSYILTEVFWINSVDNVPEALDLIQKHKPD